jgi:hypothetical protein
MNNATDFPTAYAKASRAISDFEIEYELADGMYEAAIADAVSALEFPASKCEVVSRSTVEDLHANVREAFKDASKNRSWTMSRAWRALKQALRETAGG